MAPPGQSHDAWKGSGEAWAVLGTLMSSLIVWGGVGLLVDLWLGFRWLFLPVGMVVGIAAGIYLIWHKYGRA